MKTARGKSDSCSISGITGKKAFIDFANGKLICSFWILSMYHWMDSLSPILLCSLTMQQSSESIYGTWELGTYILHTPSSLETRWFNSFFLSDLDRCIKISIVIIIDILMCYYHCNPGGGQLPFRWLVSLWVATQEIPLKGRCWLSVSKRAGLRSFKVIMLNIHHAHFTNNSVIGTIMLITCTNCAYHALVILTNSPDILVRWCTWSLNTGRKTTRVARGSSRDFSIMCQSSELLSDEIQYQATNIYEI